MRFFRWITAISMLAAIAGPAGATPIVGANIIVAQDGDVAVRFVGHSALFDNYLYLDSPTNSLGFIFRNQVTPVGTTVNLGHFTAGTELIFRLYVKPTGDDFFTGGAARNADGNAHARVDLGFSPTEVLVEFEDLFGGPFDFNDLSFALMNVVVVPEPASGLLLSLGLIGLGWSRRKPLKAGH